MNRNIELISPERAVAPLETSVVYDGIANTIQANGPMTYADFMQASMYGYPDAFYESGEAKVDGGDFSTQVSVSPFLAMSIAHWLNEQQQQHASDSFRVVEMGAGSGIMARTVLDEIADQYPALAGAVHYTILERASGMIKQQKRTLKGYPVTWVQGSAIDLPMRDIDAFISDELPDAFPAHLVTKQGTGFTELYVALDEQGRFYEAEGVLSSAELEACCHAACTYRPVADGETFAVSLNAARWVRNTLHALGEKGAALAVDYGSLHGPTREVARYYSLADGTPGRVDRALTYQYPGKVDITTDINFAFLNDKARENGARVDFVGSQADFMRAHGNTASYARVMARLALGVPSPGHVFERSHERYLADFKPGSTFTPLDLASYAKTRTTWGLDEGVPKPDTPLQAVVYAKG